MDIKPLKLEDYDAIINVWKLAHLPFKPRGRDKKDEIKRQISASPDIFLGAYVNGQLIGVIMGSDDGRKGWINRLAVHPGYRRQGLAGSLIAS